MCLKILISIDHKKLAIKGVYMYNQKRFSS